MAREYVSHSLYALGAFTVSAGERGSILLKAIAEDDDMAYKLDNTEFTMYQGWSLQK